MMLLCLIHQRHFYWQIFEYKMFSNLQEVHYCSLQSQSNVYGLAKMSLPHGQHKILVASLKGKVMSVEFQKTRPSSREVPFTYIPGRLFVLFPFYQLVENEQGLTNLVTRILECRPFSQMFKCPTRSLGLVAHLGCNNSCKLF